MTTFSEPKRQYNKRSPEQIRAELEERIKKLSDKEKLNNAVNREELQPLFEAKNKLITEKNKTSVLLGNSTLGLNYKIRCTSAKLSMLQARYDFINYTSKNYSGLITSINDRIASLALEDVIIDEDLIVATNIEDDEYHRLKNVYENSLAAYK